MTTVCEQCGDTIADGIHPRNFVQTTILDIERLYHLRGKCCACECKVSIETIKAQGVENWRRLSWMSAFFCPGCSHQIESSFKFLNQ